MFRSRADSLLSAATFTVAAGTAAILLVILAFLLRESWPALQAGQWRLFFTSADWYPLSGEYNLWPMLWASLLASAGAIVLAAPLGIGCALFIHSHAPAWLAAGFRRLVTVLAGIPSVVFGLWGLTVLVPLLVAREPPGASLLAAILILAIMVLPTIALISAAALAQVPASHALGARALGLARHAVLLRVVLPAARAGIAGGILLATARALGETMAVLMVAGNVVQLPSSLTDPVRVLTANIALEMAYAMDNHRAALYVSGLLLTLLVAALAWLAQRMELRHE